MVKERIRSYFTSRTNAMMWCLFFSFPHTYARPTPCSECPDQHSRRTALHKHTYAAPGSNLKNTEIKENRNEKKGKGRANFCVRIEPHHPIHPTQRSLFQELLASTTYTLPILPTVAAQFIFPTGKTNYFLRYHRGGGEV